MAKGDTMSKPSSPKTPNSPPKGDVKDKKTEKLMGNIKGTPSPPRFMREEVQPPMPPYPITWTAAAVCVETAGPVLDLLHLVEEANQRSRPAMSFAIVDAQELVTEELAYEESALRTTLLEAKEGPKKEDSKGAKDRGKDAKDVSRAKLGKDKDKDKGKVKDKGQGQVGLWLQPKHLQDLLAARQIRERDFEHREEAVRRATELEEAKRRAEDSRKVVEEKQAEVEAAKKSLQEFEDRDRKRIREEWWAQKAAAVAAQVAAKTTLNATPGKKNGGGNKAPKGGKETKSGAKSTPPKDATTTLKGKEANDKSLKDKKKAIVSPQLFVSPQEERLSYQEAVKKCTTTLEEAQAQIIEADRHIVNLEAKINDPFITSKIYCCLGFGDTAASLGELAACQDNLFCAILNVCKKAPPVPIPPTFPPEVVLDSGPSLGSAEARAKKSAKDVVKDKNVGDSIASKPSSPSAGAQEKGKKLPKEKVEQSLEVVVPLLVADVRTSAASSHIKSSLRKICIMDVLWEERKQEDEVLPRGCDIERPNSTGKKEKDSVGRKLKEKEAKLGLEKRPGSPPASKKEKGGKGEGDIPYTEVAEALVKTCNTLMQQVKEFRNMDTNTLFVDIPDCIIPLEDVKMDHYKHLLDEVAPELVSVPIILHCMMEQVSMVVCENKDVEALEAAKQRKEAKVLLEQAFLNLGKKTELPYHSPFGNIFLPHEFEYDEMEVPPPCEPGCTCELHPFDFDGKPVPETKRSRYEEHLNVIHEKSSYGLLKAILTRRRQDSNHKIKHEPQLSLSNSTVVDILSVEKRMLKLFPTPGYGRRDFPTPPSYPLEKRGTCMTALRKFSKIFFPATQRYRKLRHIADLLLNKKVETAPSNVVGLKEGDVTKIGVNVASPINEGDIKASHFVINATTSDVELKGRESIDAYKPDNHKNLSSEGCMFSNEGGEHTLSSSNNILTTTVTGDEEKHIRPCRFTQTEPLKYIPKKPPPLKPAFDQGKLRPHESILNYRYVDAFPDDTFAEAYAKARLALPFERMVYDKDEDFVISVLFAEEGEHTWTSHVPSLIPFGRFCSDPKASKIKIADFAASEKTFMPPTTYGIEDVDGGMSEKKHIFMGAEESLVCNGLPVQTKPESAMCHKPQATMYKDGATFLLRGDPTTTDEFALLENTLTTCLKDGLIMCFYIAKDGTIHLQVTQPTGTTFELSSSGVVLVFPTNLKELEKVAKKEAQEATHNACKLNHEEAAHVAQAEPKKGGKKGSKRDSKALEPPVDGKKVAKLEAKGDLKKKGEGKLQSETKDKDKKGGKPVDSLEHHSEDIPTNKEPNDHNNNVKSISDILQKERGEEEVWRCILPSGTIVRYRENQELQLLYANGNTCESQLHAVGPPNLGPPSPDISEADLKARKDAKGKGKGQEKAGDKSEKGAKGAKKGKDKIEKDAKEAKLENVGKNKEGPASSQLPAPGSPIGDTTFKPALVDCQWIVTNNKGCCVLQTPFQPPPPPEELEPDPKTKTDTKGKEKAKGGAANATIEDKEKRKNEKDGSKGKSRQRKKGKGENEDVDEVNPGLVLEAPIMMTPTTILVEPKPILSELPKKRVVQVTDPESEAVITVREDLVILMQPADESYCFVQHADGTQILTQQKKVTLEKKEAQQVSPPLDQLPISFCHLHNPLPFRSLLQDFKQEIGASDVPIKYDNIVGNHQQSPPKEPLKSLDLQTVACVPDSAGLAKATLSLDNNISQLSSPTLSAIAHTEEIKKFSFSKRKSRNKIISEPALLEIDQDKGKTCPHCQASQKEVHRPSPILVEPPPMTTVWHMRKDGLPNIQGKLGEGVAIQLHTYEGRYFVAWSQPTQQLSVQLPNGVLIYTNDKTVFVDTSRGVDQGKPDALLIKKKKRELAMNTNGLHAFDLEEGSLYHTDKEGNGFVTQKGSVVNVLVNGLQMPPSSPPEPPYEPINFLSMEEISSSESIEKDPSSMDPKLDGLNNGPKVIAKGQEKADQQRSLTQPISVPLASLPYDKKTHGSIGQLGTIPQSGGAYVRRPSQLGGTIEPPIAEFAGLFTPKLHIPVPPLLPPKLPLERDSQWGIKGLPAPIQPPDPQLGLGGNQISTNTAVVVSQPGLGNNTRSTGSILDSPIAVPGDIGINPKVLDALGEVPREQEESVSYELASNSDVSEMGLPGPEYPKLLSTELGPPARVFVAHDGGYGFEICGEKEFAKYLQQKKADPLCHIAREGFFGGEENTTFHTFIRVEDLHKEPYAPFVPKEENPLLVPVPINHVNKPEPLTEKTMAEAKLDVIRRGTKCPWIDINFEFPILPRIIAPCKPPTLPCCKETLVSFRRICEYPEFSTEQLEKVERALGEYEKWRCEVLEKPLKEWVDPRAEKEIILEREISECIRQSLAEQKIFEAQERGVVDSRYAAGLLRRMRNGEAWRIEQMLREERALQTQRKQVFQKYLEMKCHPTLCIHKPNLLQKDGPYRPIRNAVLRYWKCEEGLKALLDMLGETVMVLEEEDAEDPDQVTMEEIEILIKATKKEAMEIFEEMMRLMEEFRNTNLIPEEKEFKLKEPEEPPCCFIEWMILIEKYHKKNYPKAYEEEAAELEQRKREEYLRMANIECGKLLEDMICETETDYARFTAYRSPSFHSSEYLRDEFWDELMNLIADPPPQPPIPEVEPMSPESSVTEDSRSLFRQKWDTAPWHLNAAYLSVEEAFRIFSYFNSVYLLREQHLPRDRPQQFHLMPGHMNFRKVKHGSTTLQVAYLLNFHDDMGRFKIRKLDECLKVYYKHGPVAPGMLRKIRVFFKALRVGDYKDEVEIITEFDVFKIPINATVLSLDQDNNPDDYSLHKDAPQPNQMSYQVKQVLPCEPTGPPPIDNIPTPEDSCKVVQDLLSWLESDVMGDVLIKGHR